jgi:hypothetical protein
MICISPALPTLVFGQLISPVYIMAVPFLIQQFIIRLKLSTKRCYASRSALPFIEMGNFSSIEQNEPESGSSSKPRIFRSVDLPQQMVPLWQQIHPPTSTESLFNATVSTSSVL